MRRVLPVVRHGSFLTRIKLGLTQSGCFTPSPLMGEGWGEGEEVGASLYSGKGCSPSPQPSPARGEGAKSKFYVSPINVFLFVFNVEIKLCAQIC